MEKTRILGAGSTYLIHTARGNNHISPSFFLAPLLFVALSFSLTAHSATAYMIGNSLLDGVQPYALTLMAGQRDKELTTGLHRVGGASLDYIWSNPEAYGKRVYDYDGYTNALTNYAWDNVILQPYLDKLGEGTLGLDTQRMIDFIDYTLAGPSIDTNFYIYTSYPRRENGDYQAAWSQTVPDDANQDTTHARQYYELLQQNLLDNYGQDSSIYIIPIGEVLYELDILFKDGIFPGFTNVFSDLYLDNVHLNSEFGNWIAANTVYATLFREDPTGLVKPRCYFGVCESDPLSPELSAQFQEIVWNTVSSYPYSGVIATPIPATIWLFGSGLLGLIGMARRKKA